MKTTSPNHHLLLTALTATGLLSQSALAALPGQYNYSLNADWSDVANPNGVWSYNLGGDPIAVHQEFWWGQAGWGYQWIGDGCIIKGSQITGTDPWGNPSTPAHDWQPGDVMMHALSIPYGGETTFLNVKWTSPADGTIDITGRAWDGGIFAFPDRDVAWSLSLGGQAVANRSSVRGLFRTDTGAQLGANLIGGNSLTGIPVNAGEVVEFRVLTQTYYGQFLGVEENITLTVVPEPGSVSLFVAGILGMGMFRRQRRHHAPAQPGR
jgi:hypothetical protein